MGHPSWMQSGLLLLMLACSIALFWKRFGRVVNIIRDAKKDSDFNLQPVAPRLGQFAWEVLLQGRVIRERPLPGLAHALVFWGFCAFALVSLNHLAEGFGGRILSRESIYFRFVDGFALLVSVSIIGLAVRRFIWRPRWLGPLSPESGVIAFLIFALMITYLAGRWWFTEATVWGDANWWAHTILLLVFLPLIPHTKHLHLVLSPITIFLKRQGFSRIPPLASDEDFGLVSGKDVTRIDALQAYSCVECGRCTEHCPAFNTGKVLNPKEIILGLRRYLNTQGPGSDQPLLDGGYILEEAAFQCTSCGGCEYQCPVGIQHLPIIIGLRRGAVNTGAWEDEHGTKLFLNIERGGNSLGFAAAERQKFIERNSLPVYDGTQEYCLWLGCMGSYDPQGREIVLALVELLRYLGVTFGVLSREKCNGDPVRRLGNDYLFQQMVEFNAEQLRQSKATRLISICPHCVRTIGEDWKEHASAFTIEHHSELLERFRSRLPAGGASERVVFHDPCYLGRYRGIYDAPRSVLERSGEVVEPGRTRERSFCCGAGGGMMFLGEEKGKRINVERAQELVSTGAPVIGTACPFCQTMFRDALANISQSPPRLLDIAQIAAAPLRQGQVQPQ